MSRLFSDDILSGRSRSGTPPIDDFFDFGPSATSPSPSQQPESLYYVSPSPTPTYPPFQQPESLHYGTQSQTYRSSSAPPPTYRHWLTPPPADHMRYRSQDTLHTEPRARTPSPMSAECRRYFDTIGAEDAPFPPNITTWGPLVDADWAHLQYMGWPRGYGPPATQPQYPAAPPPHVRQAAACWDDLVPDAPLEDHSRTVCSSKKRAKVSPRTSTIAQRRRMSYFLFFIRS